TKRPPNTYIFPSTTADSASSRANGAVVRFDQLNNVLPAVRFSFSQLTLPMSCPATLADSNTSRSTDVPADKDRPVLVIVVNVRQPPLLLRLIEPVLLAPLTSR